jgi:hypothetical protein
MHKERFVLVTDEHGHLPFIPVLNPYQKIEIIVMADDKEEVPVLRKPSPFLTGKIRFMDDDIIASPLRPDEWGTDALA